MTSYRVAIKIELTFATLVDDPHWKVGELGTGCTGEDDTGYEHDHDDES